MQIYDAINKRRTIRKFKQTRIDRGILIKFVEAARLAPSAANIQPLKYLIVDEDKYVGKVFETVKWAGYIVPEGNPKKGEEPTAYIVILADTEIKKSNYQHDAGAAAQNIMLAAIEEGIGSCWIGSINREALREILNIPESLEINTIIALGYPAEEPVVEEYSGFIKYYKDEKGKLHVPKRSLKNLVMFNKLR